MLYDQAELEAIASLLIDEMDAGKAHALSVARKILERRIGYPQGHVCTTCGSALPEFGGITLDHGRGEVRYKGKFIRNLTGSEWAVFRLLMDANGRTLSKESILQGAYQLTAFADKDLPEIKIIDVYICKLRKKIKPLGLNIETSWGRGYYLEEPVHEHI